MEKKIKMLITSVGSLVGQNIQDVLEYPLFKRRDMVDLIGTNSIAINPNNFRCDRCYLVPNTGTPDFINKIKQIISTEKPDLILSGRDEDTETIAKLMAENKDLPGKLPYGKAITLTYALNKWETWKFFERYGLPFASTYVIGESGGIEGFKAFVEMHGFPLIAKPIEGFASKGVFYIRSWEDAEIIFTYEKYMFQEYLGNAASLDGYFKQMDGLTPLFAHAPNIFHHSCHTVIAPDGSFDPIFISRNDHESGVTIGFKKVENQILEELTIKLVKAVIIEGGYGPITVQFREDRNGNWKAQEINMRTNGNTFPRFTMGQDDLGLIMKGVLPDLNFPVYNAPEENKSMLIGKTLASKVMLPQNIFQLQNDSFWNINS